MDFNKAKVISETLKLCNKFEHFYIQPVVGSVCSLVTGDRYFFAPS